MNTGQWPRFSQLRLCKSGKQHCDATMTLCNLATLGLWGVGLCCDVLTIADEAWTKIIFFYDRSTNTGYKSSSVAKPMMG